MAVKRGLAQITERKEEGLTALSHKEMQALGQHNTKIHAEIKKQTQARVAAAQASFAAARLLLDPRQIEALTDKLARDIHRRLKGSAPLVLTLYPEGAHFSNQLTKKLGVLDLTLEENYLDFWIDGDHLTLRVEPLVDLRGRTILLTTAVISDGKKLQAALAYCKAKGARAVYCASLIDMPATRTEALKHLKPSFCGAVCEEQALAGFGCDVDGFFRNEPGVWVLPTAKALSKMRPSTSGILAALEEKQESGSEPLVFQEKIPVNQKALDKAREAEATFKQLDLLYTGQQLKAKVLVTARQMKAALEGSNPVVLSMQKGGSHFTTLLTEHLAGLPLEESYMHLTRYGNSKVGSTAKLLAEPAVDVKGRTVIISEDLVEGGLTLQMAISLCLQRGASAVYVVAMGDKPQKRLPGLSFIKPDFCCYRFDDRFLVGTGLDEQENLRNKFGVWAHRKKEEAAAALGTATTQALPRSKL